MCDPLAFGEKDSESKDEHREAGDVRKKKNRPIKRRNRTKILALLSPILPFSFATMRSSGVRLFIYLNFVPTRGEIYLSFCELLFWWVKYGVFYLIVET